MAPRTQRQSLRAKSGRRSSLIVSLGTFMLVLGLIMMVAVGGWLLSAARNQSEVRERQWLEAVQRGNAERLSAAVAAFTTPLLGLAQTDALSAPLQDGADNDAVKAWEARLQRLLPDASRLMLVPPEVIAGAEYAADLTFADVALLSEARKKDSPVLVEAQRIQQADRHLNLAQPVRDSATGQLVGFIYATLPMERLAEPFRRLQWPGGYAELSQRVGNEVVPVLRSGAAEDGEGTPLSAELLGTPWLLRYWPPRTSTGLLSSAPAYFLPVATGLAAAWALLVYAVFGRLSRTLRDDMASVSRLIADLLRGRAGTRPYPVKLAEVRRVVEPVTAMGKVGAASDAAAAAAFADDEFEGVAAADRQVIDVEELSESAEITAVTAAIFKAYDIRGVVGENLDTAVLYDLGLAIGSEAHDRGEKTVVVARDGRASGEELLNALCDGLVATGRDVVQVGQVPTPVLYFAINGFRTGSGVMVTASHNPANYNGLKVVVGGETLAEHALYQLYERLTSGRIHRSGGGKCRQADILARYIDAIVSAGRLSRPLKVVVDCGNGVAGRVAPVVLQQIGCQVIELYCDVDGSFPNHGPDPSQPENLRDLRSRVVEEKADLGLAFDGDGDRLGVVDGQGRIIWPDRLLMLFAADILQRSPGAKVVFDVKCSRHLGEVVRRAGGEPILWKSGHSLVRAKVDQSGAVLGGELSGHIFFKDRWNGFDDALYAAARLLELIAWDSRSVAQIFADLPAAVSTPELRVQMDDAGRHKFMSDFVERARLGASDINTIDGVRAEFANGWGLVRSSNTMPYLVFRFEADSDAELESIQDAFRKQALKIKPDLILPF